MTPAHCTLTRSLMVEQNTHNVKGSGSIPLGSTNSGSCLTVPVLKAKVVNSLAPLFLLAGSSAVERISDTDEVVSSTLTQPTDSKESSVQRKYCLDAIS